MRRFSRIGSDQRGVGTIEYALIASLLSVAALTGYQKLGTAVEGKFTSVEQSISNAM